MRSPISLMEPFPVFKDLPILMLDMPCWLFMTISPTLKTEASPLLSISARVISLVPLVFTNTGCGEADLYLLCCFCWA